MKQIIQFQLLIFSLLLWSFTVKSQTCSSSVTLVSIKDAHVSEYIDHIQKNSGGNSINEVARYSGASDDDKRLFMAFDLSSIPQGATIISAVCSLNLVSTRNGTSNKSIRCYKLNGNWTEGTGTGIDGQIGSGVKWTSQPSISNDPYSDIVTIGSSTGWYHWDVLPYVQDWITNGEVNYGLAFREGSGSSNPGTKGFASRENSNASKRPIIVITYSLASASIDTQNACGPYTWIDGNTYTISNNTATYNVPSGNAVGCDSIINLDLTITHSDYTQNLIGDTAICSGSNYADTATTNYVSYTEFSKSDKNWIECNSIIPSLMNSSHSIFTWMKKSSTVSNSNGAHYITAINTSGSGNTSIFGVWKTEKLVVYNGSSSHLGTTTITDGVWHHVGYTYDHTTGVVIMYVDGTPENTYNTSITINATDRFSIGQEFDGSSRSNYFDGALTELSVWNGSLDSTDVSLLRDETINSTHPKYANLQAYYPMFTNCGTSNTTLLDKSLNTNNGTISHSDVQVLNNLEQIPNFNSIAHYSVDWTLNGTTVSTTPILNTNIVSPGAYGIRLYNDHFAITDTFNTTAATTCYSAQIAIDSNVSCNGLSDAGATATIIGGATPFTYSWSNSATTASITGLTAGTYTVTVTDANSDTSSTSVIITQPVALVAATVVDANISCNGYSDGGATASATGGTSSYTYSWNNSATTASITGVVAGTYSTTITDANGCTDSTSITITEPLALVASTTLDANDTGGGTGGATVTATGGTSTYTYSWSNGATTASITGLAAGTYSTTITDNSGCTDSASVIISSGPSANITAQTNVTCNGSSDGGATASVTGGTSPFTYAWSNTATTATITGVAAGTYSVTITDANSNSVTTSATITQPTSLTASSVVSTAIDCNGGTQGQVTASGAGGTTPFTYSWNTGGTAALETGLGAGTYSVTITDQNGCTDSTSVVLSQPVITGSSAAVTSLLDCNNDTDGQVTASGSGGTTPYTYSWNTGGTAGLETGLGSGTYSVTVTDQNGCTDSTSVNLTQPTALLSATVVDSNISCNSFSDGGATASATGGTSAYTYTWSNSATTASITGVIASTYSVTITDQNGCTDSTTVTVSEPATMMAAVVIDSNISCNGFADGGATASATGGNTPYTFSWSNSATTASITGVVAGTYSTTITDANGCTSTNNGTVTQPATMVAAVVIDSNTSCNSFADGGATASSTGGTSPYTYSWSNSATTASITGVVAGTYTTTITDANGCTSTSSSTVTEPVVLANTVSLDSNDLGNGGGATASATGGNTPYVYSWSNGATTASVTGLFAGTYTVTVTDVKACSGSAPQSITITAGPIITMVLDSNVQCNGYSNGGITASVIGGTTPYTYAWNNSATIASLTGLIAGTYSVTVTDNNSLSSTASITVTEPSIPTTVTTVDTNVSCFGGSNGAATAGISQINTIYFEGFENYSGASTYSATTALLGLSGASFETSTTQGRVRIPAGANYVRTGNFSVTLDAAVNGAFPDPVNYLIKSWDLSAYTANPLNIDFWMMDHGEEVDANDRVWIRGSNTDSWIEVYNLVSPNLSNGVWHNISIPRIDTIITNAGQTLTSTFEVRFGQEDNFTSSSITASDGFTFDDISVTTNSVSQNAYLWSNNDTTALVTGLIAGKYMVTVTNGAGCSAVDSVTIIEPTLLTTSTVVDSNATCNGLTDGGGTASANGGTAPYAYAWSTSATTATATGLTNAKHFVTITDVQGCAAIDSITIIVEDTVRPMVITQNINSYLDNTGNSNITTTDVDNGSNDACGIQSMQLDIATFNCNNIGANTVYLIITDVNGNSDSATAIITVLDTLNPVVSVQNYTAYLDATGNISIDSSNVDNGSTDNCSIQSIALSNSNFTCANVGTNAVLVTVTDVNGNADTATATVTVSDTISPTVNTQNVTVYLDATGSASITTADINNGTTDNCSIQSLSLDSTQFDCSETGYSTVVLTATDANGNTSTNTATVTVLDTISPTVITQNHTAYLNPSGFAIITESDIDNGSSDNCSIQSLTLSQVIFNCADTGLNTVALQVTDLNGNISSANATVTILDTLLPTVNTQNTTVYLDASGQASIVVADIDNGSTDNCSVQNIVLDITNFDCSNVGPNTVVLTVTDVNGNLNTATAQVTVMDTIAPIMVTQDITVYLDATGMAVITDADIDNGSTDNCSIQSYSLDISSFNCNDLGTNTVILAATDVNGNVNSASAVVTVLDTITPVITCPVAFSDCGPEITIPDVITTDNCITTLTLTSGIASNQTFPVGLTTNTYVVEDITGNSATCSVDITRYPQPVVTVREDTTVFYEQSVTLYSTSEFVVEWDWTPRMFLDNASSNQPICTPQHTSNYTLVGKSADGCYSDPKTVAITMNEAGAVLVPNTFSPNGDGYNDYFEIAGISFHPDMRITIFNRNGEILFQETGYENNWDGTANGKLLPVATYYFILDQGNGKDPIKGDITIIK